MIDLIYSFFNLASVVLCSRNLEIEVVNRWAMNRVARNGETSAYISVLNRSVGNGEGSAEYLNDIDYVSANLTSSTRRICLFLNFTSPSLRSSTARALLLPMMPMNVSRTLQKHTTDQDSTTTVILC